MITNILILIKGGQLQVLQIIICLYGLSIYCQRLNIIIIIIHKYHAIFFIYFQLFLF